MSHTFRKDCSLYEHHSMSKFDTSAHSSATSGTSTSSGQSFGGFSFSRQQHRMDANQVSFGSDNHFGFSGSDGFSGSKSGYGGNFGERVTSHQNSGGSFSARNHSGNCYSYESRPFGNSGHTLESGSSLGSNDGGSAGQSSSFSSRLPLLGSGGTLTVVASGEGGPKKGGPPLDWDRLVDGVFTDEIGKLFWKNFKPLQLTDKWATEQRLSELNGPFPSVPFLICTSGFSKLVLTEKRKLPIVASQPDCMELLFSFILLYIYKVIINIINIIFI